MDHNKKGEIRLIPDEEFERGGPEAMEFTNKIRDRYNVLNTRRSPEAAAVHGVSLEQWSGLLDLYESAASSNGNVLRQDPENWIAERFKVENGKVTFEGDLCYGGVKYLTKVPEGMVVTGRVDLTKCQNLKNAPTNVKGDTLLGGCRELRQLPEGAVYEGKLSIHGTGIEHLPKDITVKGAIEIDSNKPELIDEAEALMAAGKIGDVKLSNLYVPKA